MAVDTERGLLVPVIRDANTKSVAQVAREARVMIERAVNGRSMPDDLVGWHFHHHQPGHARDRWVHAHRQPAGELPFLGVGRIVAKPVVVNGEIVVRQMMVLSLSFDHRIVDGAPAARFLQRVKNLIEDPYLLLL